MFNPAPDTLSKLLNDLDNRLTNLERQPAAQRLTVKNQDYVCTPVNGNAVFPISDPFATFKGGAMIWAHYVVSVPGNTVAGLPISWILDLRNADGSTIPPDGNGFYYGSGVAGVLGAGGSVTTDATSAVSPSTYDGWGFFTTGGPGSFQLYFEGSALNVSTLEVVSAVVVIPQ